jgi:hypothetical protein
MRHAPALLLGAALLAGCEGSVRALSAGADGVSFEFPLALAADADRQAQLYCANLGRAAERETLTQKGGDRAIASYACR